MSTGTQSKARARSLLWRVVRTIGIVLLRVLEALFIFLTLLPVVLLPLATSTPAYVWVPLAVAGVALLVLTFWLARSARVTAARLAGFLLVATLAVTLSQAFAMTPPIVDAAGKPVAGSIASLEAVRLNGTRQWITIRGRDAHNPVLLFLAGGPGGSHLAATRLNLQGLEDSFVVVDWDQPGAGKSYGALPHASLTPERYIADAHALVLYLRERFGQDKIYLVGESWGSTLGVWLVQRYPELFQAFVGADQMVAFTQNDTMCYDLAIRWAEQRGDMAQAESLRRMGPPPYYGKKLTFKVAAYLNPLNSYMEQFIPDLGYRTIPDLRGSEYGVADKVFWALGAMNSLDAVYAQLWDVDFRTQATRLDVPVYFMIGRYDYNAMASLAEEYYNLLQAPHKELIWFELSGHSPWRSESAKFVQVMKDTVLAQTRP